jgi:hypothetical protein
MGWTRRYSFGRVGRSLRPGIPVEEDQRLASAIAASQRCGDAIDCASFAGLAFLYLYLLRRLHQARQFCQGIVRRDRLVDTISAENIERLTSLASH